MAILKNIVSHLEQMAPLAYQESYDNAGLITGKSHQEVKKVLVSLDCTEEVVEEAIQTGCQLIVAHHPIVFKGLKKITGSNYVERTVLKAIKNDIALYAIHTNLDAVHTGVNRKIGERLGLKNLQILQPRTDTLGKLVTFVPFEYAEKVLDALAEAGAGNIGNYKKCSFQLAGTGTFMPNEQANPFIGKQGELETVQEKRLEVILPLHLKGKVMAALRASHPYEEVAYYFNVLENENQEVGFGMVGELDEPMPTDEFFAYLKNRMALNVIRATKKVKNTIQKVAVCGGTGSFLLKKAINAKADIFISADFKYHEFFDAEHDIIIADIGHYESERFTIDLLVDWLKRFDATLDVIATSVVTNPIHYL